MWTFFAYPDPEPAVVTDLANAFLANDLLVEDLVRAIFMHPELRLDPGDERASSARPAEWVAACLRS